MDLGETNGPKAKDDELELGLFPIVLNCNLIR